MWQAYLDTLPTGRDASPIYMTWHFANDEAAANQLGELARAGIKTATSRLLWEFEANEEELPQPGDLSIITDWQSRPLCIVETTAVEVRPFDRVTAEHAFGEGEGDRSLEGWRAAHWLDFSEGCSRLGRPAAADMPVVCERFRVVYPPIALKPAVEPQKHREQ
jgi:uncharacterized protein YhfF